MFCGFLALASGTAHADMCQIHTAYATAGTVTVSTAAHSSAQNGVVGYGFFNAFVCTTTGIAFAVKNLDPSTMNSYGFALVGVNGNAIPGTVYATTGPVNGPTFTGNRVGGVQSLAWTNGPIHNLPVGLYMLVLGAYCSQTCTAQLYGDAAFGQFYPFIYADTSTNFPWTFSSSTGFSGFTSSAPAVSLDLSASAPQIISGTTATVTLNSTLIGHIYYGATISVQGVATRGATGLNCTSCIVTGVSLSSGKVSYTLPSSGFFSGNINSGATLSVSPVLVEQTEYGSPPSTSVLCSQGCFVAPSALIY